MRTEGEQPRAGIPSWEAALRRGLDQMADLGDESPPSVAELQLLVAEVQLVERRRALRELALFWGCAGVVLTALLYALAQRPVAFLAVQGAAGMLLLLGAGAWLGLRRQVAP